jgi:hypothetical protein
MKTKDVLLAQIDFLKPCFITRICSRELGKKQLDWLTKNADDILLFG